MEAKNFLSGQKVKRLGSSKDYTTGRIGVVVEVKEPRVRVKWLYEASGNPIKGNGIRTWVNKKFLEITL